MKRLFLSLYLLLLVPCIGYSQTWDEFFKQKKTKEKYLLEQLAALKIYAGYAMKGYQTVHSGLGMIRDLTGGELSLHDLFISSLSAAGPVIRNNARVGEIVLLQLKIRKELKRVTGLDLTADQRQYVEAVRDKVLVDCEKDLEELALILGSGVLDMDEADRLDRLKRIHTAMLDKWSFTVSFTTAVRNLVLMKEKEIRDSSTSGKIYGITD